jgi:hypothetical protein
VTYGVVREFRPARFTAVMTTSPCAAHSRCQSPRGIVSCRDVMRGSSRVGDRAQQDAARATRHAMLHAFILIPETARTDLTLLNCVKKHIVRHGPLVGGVLAL